jgi:hypothetical protein
MGMKAPVTAEAVKYAAAFGPTARRISDPTERQIWENLVRSVLASHSAFRAAGALMRGSERTTLQLVDEANFAELPE